MVTCSEYKFKEISAFIFQKGKDSNRTKLQLHVNYGFKVEAIYF